MICQLSYKTFFLLLGLFWLAACAKDDDKKTVNPPLDYRTPFVGNYQFQVVHYGSIMGNTQYDTVETNYAGSISLDDAAEKIVIRYRDGDNNMGCDLFGAWINPTVAADGQLHYIDVLKQCTHHSSFSHSWKKSSSFPEITADSLIISIGSGSNGSKYGQLIYGKKR